MKEGARMKYHTDNEELDYIADMAAQLAAMSGKRYPFVTALLRAAASAARDRDDDAPVDEPDDCRSCQR